MDVKLFIKNTINTMDEKNFFELKERLIGEYISFEYIDDKNVNVKIFSEKILDYFDKVELKTGNSFEKIVSRFFSDWDMVVKKYIPKEPVTKKGVDSIPKIRSIKYYKHAQDNAKSRNVTMKQMTEYSRIMMSLYMSVINNDMQKTNSFLFSTDELNIDKIIKALKNEKNPRIAVGGKKSLFDIKDLYCTDTATFIMSIIMFYCLEMNLEKGEI